MFSFQPSKLSRCVHAKIPVGLCFVEHKSTFSHLVIHSISDSLRLPGISIIP